MHFGAHLERAPTVRKQASPGQARHERRPGSCVHQGPSPERATHVVTPLQGSIRDGRFSQGVALGWLVVGPLALKASSFARLVPGHWILARLRRVERTQHSMSSFVLVPRARAPRPSFSSRSSCSCSCSSSSSSTSCTSSSFSFWSASENEDDMDYTTRSGAVSTPPPQPFQTVIQIGLDKVPRPY